MRACGWRPATMWRASTIGASIACDGVCLTVVATRDRAPRPWFDVEVSAETPARTTASAARLEAGPPRQPGTGAAGRRRTGRAHRLGPRRRRGRDRRAAGRGRQHPHERRVPEALARFIAPKGSVALNGTSLTVNEVEGPRFGVNLIPHTKDVTTWGDRPPRATRVNLEIDTLARYVARLRDWAMTPGIGHNGGPTLEPGAGWRRHAWSRARADLLPTLPLEVVRLRVARARNWGSLPDLCRHPRRDRARPDRLPVLDQRAAGCCGAARRAAGAAGRGWRWCSGRRCGAHRAGARRRTGPGGGRAGARAARPTASWPAPAARLPAGPRSAARDWSPPRGGLVIRARRGRPASAAAAARSVGDWVEPRPPGRAPVSAATFLSRARGCANPARLRCPGTPSLRSEAAMTSAMVRRDLVGGGDHRGRPQRPHVHPRRPRGSRERGRPGDPGADGDARRDQLHGHARPRPDLPGADRASGSTRSACR